MFCTVMEVYIDCFGRAAQLQASVKSSCWYKVFVSTFHDVIEITNDKPFQISVLRRASKCHCKVAEFLLHIFYRNYFKALITLLNSHK
jgi:hypothetical protein